jgi:hypothetical protein
VGSLAYVQSWIVDFNSKDRGHANYPFWLKFRMLPTDLRIFVDLLANQFSEVLILGNKHNSFQHNSRVCVEVDLKKKPLLHIIFVTPMTVNDVNLSFVFRRINGLNP